MPSRSALCAVVTFAIVGGLSSHAHAALTPAKPSDVVTAYGSDSSDECGNFTQLHQVASRGLSDGRTVAFAVLPKTVFVLTGFEWSTVAGPADRFAGVNLSIVDGSGAFATPASSGGAIADASGNATGSVAVAPGVIVKAGARLCVGGSGSPTYFGVTVHGFVTKDK